MTTRRIIAAVLGSLGVIVAAVANLAVDNHAAAPVPFANLGLAPDHSLQAAPIAAAMPRFFVVGAEGEDNSKANVRLWDYAKQINGGKHLPNYPQKTGDCVSFGAKNAGENFLCTAIAKGLLPDAEFHPLFPPYTYGTSRVNVGQKKLGRSSGSVGAWAAEAVAKYGVLRADNPDTPPYSGKLADDWGWNGVPKELIEASKMFTFDTVAQVSSAIEARDAICNGYPVTIASDFGTTKIVPKDGRRVAVRNSRWYHQMCLIGFDGTAASGTKYFYVINSWGETAHPTPMQGEPPGGFWIEEKDVEYITRQGDSFAYSGFSGFPAQNLKPDFTIPVSDAGPVARDNIAQFAALEDSAMFPLDPDLQMPGNLIAFALIVAALAAWFLWGNRHGRAAIVACLALTTNARILTAQDWGQISQVAKSPTPTSASSPDGSVLPDADVIAAFGQIATVAMSHRPETVTTVAIQSPDFGGIVRAAFATDAFEDPRFSKLLAIGEAAHTPHAEVVRVLALLPEPQVGFVDYGCGYDARWCVAAAERWKNVPIIGVEIDHDRAVAARRHVADLGLADRITIVEGDATAVDVEADVGVAYLFSDTLEALRPRLEKLRAFASYLHRPPGLNVTKNGASWVYTRPVQQATAIWQGQAYTHTLCQDPTCQMCWGPDGIGPQLQAGTKSASQAAAPRGHYEMQSVRRCEYGPLGRVKKCWTEQVQVWVPAN